MRSDNRKQRHKKMLDLLATNPMLTDAEIASSLGVSLSTVRLDRSILAIPELRERTKMMAERATSKLRSLKTEEVAGELLELEPDKTAVSVMTPGREMAFRHTSLVSDYYLYAQASTLAIATINSEMVVVKAARLSCKEPVYVGERLLARSKVGVNKGNEYAVSVHTKVDGREIFVGRFVVVAKDANDTDRSEPK